MRQLFVNLRQPSLAPGSEAETRAITTFSLDRGCMTRLATTSYVRMSDIRPQHGQQSQPNTSIPAGTSINENGARCTGDRQAALLKHALDTNALGGHIYSVSLQAHVYALKTDATPLTALPRRSVASRLGAACHSARPTLRTTSRDVQAEQYLCLVQLLCRRRWRGSIRQ